MAYHLAATALGRSGLWQQGVSLASMAAAEGTKLSPRTLTSIVGGCAKGSRWKEALAILQWGRPAFREALHLPDHPAVTPEGEHGGQSPDPSTDSSRGDREPINIVPAYTLAMVACRGADRYTEGLGVLTMVEEDGVRRDEAFFRVALKCCAKVKAARTTAAAVGGVRQGGEGGGEWIGIGTRSGADIADEILDGMSAQGIAVGVQALTDVVQVMIDGWWSVTGGS